MPQNSFERAFSIVKMSAREVTIFPEKNLNWLFFIKNARNQYKILLYG